MNVGTESDLIAAMANEIEELREANAELAAERDAMIAKVAISEDKLARSFVTLREWDHNEGPSGNFVERPYPYGPIKRFVQWFNTTSQWKESPEMVYHQWLRFTRDLTDERNDAADRAAKAAA